MHRCSRQWCSTTIRSVSVFASRHIWQNESRSHSAMSSRIRRIGSFLSEGSSHMSTISTDLPILSQMRCSMLTNRSIKSRSRSHSNTKRTTTTRNSYRSSTMSSLQRVVHMWSDSRWHSLVRSTSTPVSRISSRKKTPISPTKMSSRVSPWSSRWRYLSHNSKVRPSENSEMQR